MAQIKRVSLVSLSILLISLSTWAQTPGRKVIVLIDLFETDASQREEENLIVGNLLLDKYPGAQLISINATQQDAIFQELKDKLLARDQVVALNVDTDGEVKNENINNLKVPIITARTDSHIRVTLTSPQSVFQATLLCSSEDAT